MATTEQIQKLADLTYLSQNTGVSSAELNAAYEAVGIDSSDNFAFNEAHELLRANGYTPGEQKDFYGNNSAVDIGAKLLSERWQDAPTEEELAAAGLEGVGIVNSTIANSAWLTQELQNQGIDASQTSAGTGATLEDAVAQRDELNDMLGDVNPYWKERIDVTGSYDNATLDMLEWEKLKAPITATVTTPSVDSGYTGEVSTGSPQVPTGTQVTGGGTGPSITPYYTGTPNLGNVNPVYDGAQTGLTEVSIPTYEKGLERQAEQFQQRAQDQQQYYQPQTQQEQEAAGTGPSFENVLYRNNMGMSMYIQHINGIPSQPIPQGYYRVTGFGTEAQTQAGSAAQTAQGQNEGGVVKGFNESSLVTKDDLAQLQRNLAAQVYAAPGEAVAAPPVSYIDPNAYGSVIESTAGQALPTAPTIQADQVAQIETATTADTPATKAASQVTPQQAYSDIQNAVSAMTPAQLAGLSQSITAAQQQGTAVSGLDAATGQSIDVAGAPTRTMQTGETVEGTGVDQTQVGQAFGTGEVQAASVQDELAGLMQQFEGGNTPAWAAGSMRNATAMLAARGLGASSLAGQAVIQAAMEAALPIAQIDAGNKQQVALFKAEQRAKFMQMDFDQAFQAKVMNAAKVSEIANMNFTAEQQIALENSKAANTMALQNLSNDQALVMAEAAALSQIDMANLNNRQQAAVQNAQNFLQMDMANLNNAQQTALFKQQSLVNSILSDQAAANAAQQFNATSENQTNQFFANLAASVNQFNAAQINAMKQFNADEVNALLEFNAGIQNQREMFNAQNYLVVAQANAQWRQNLATINTAAANESNMDYAQTVNGLTVKSLDEIWQRERDVMDYAFTQSENAADRALSILLGDKQLQSIREQLESEEDQALGSLLTKIFFSSDAKSIFGS